MFSVGCVGDAPKQIIGTWRYVDAVNPAQDDMFWTFNDQGDVYFYDATTSTLDTGRYEMYMVGTLQQVKITGTTISDAYIPMEGEWTIVRIDINNLCIGIKMDPGGFLQRDLTKQ